METCASSILSVLNRLLLGNTLVSAMKLFVIMLTLSVTVRLSESYLGKKYRSDAEIAHIIQMIYMAVGMCVMFALYKSGKSQWRKDRDRRRIKDGSRIDATLISISLVIFYVFSVAFGILNLVVEFYNPCPKAGLVEEVMFTSMRMVYFTAQTLFCIVLRNAQFKKFQLRRLQSDPSPRCERRHMV